MVKTKRTVSLIPQCSCPHQSADLGLDDAKIQIKSEIKRFFLKKTRKSLWIQEKALSLQQIIKAPPFFLEWTWPSEDGFFITQTLVI